MSHFRPPLEIARLCRRFRATIGLNRQVVVQYWHPVVQYEQRVVVGLPHLDLRDVIYVQVTSGRLHMVPKGCIISIKALFPREGDPDNDRADPVVAEP